MKERILQAAADLIERYGFKGFTMDELAIQMAMSKKTLYRHFRSKTEIVEAAVIAWMSAEKRQTLEAIDRASDWPERLVAAMDIYSHRQMPIRLLDEINRFYPELKHLVLDLSAFKIDQQRQVLLQAREAGELNEKLDIEVLLLIMDGIFMNLVQEASRHSRDFSVAILVETAQQLLLHGLLKTADHTEDSSLYEQPGLFDSKSRPLIPGGKQS